jgi:hypothetical protein
MRLDLSEGAVELLRALRNDRKVKECDARVAEELVSAGAAEYQGEWLVLTVDGENVSTSVIRRFP